ncbi:helix-turn-helix transcriptional regulator [Streptomyces pseudogriseolus]|uniref:helix-turn-helix transcriptional regulator n=1 Tax=Streptomyces pseudogriseolus TaxID=36817 RepID=UPI00347BD41E
MGNLRELSPYAAEDAAGFVESMRRLKELSGMTFRELEEQAGRNGDVLARSTLADVLRRDRLPRPDVLAAFVRACGDGQRVGDWLDARERIAEGGGRGVKAPAPSPAASASASPPAPSGDDEEVNAVGQDGEEAVPGASTPGRRRRSVLALAAVALLLVAGAGVWAWQSGTEDARDGASDGAPVANGERRAPVDGWVTIRPAGHARLCLTDGRDRRGAYDSAVAVHLPCAEVPVPRTYLEPAGAGLYRIQWHHPELGKGCLTVLGDGPVKGMLEPRDDCADATLFRPEPAPEGSGAAGAYRFRTVPGAQCVGTADDSVAEGVEAVQEPCADAGDSLDQYFVVRAD